MNDEQKEIIEKNHFIMQTVRIPMNEKPTLKKIIQLALNIGQYYGTKNYHDLALKYDKIEDFLLVEDTKTNLSDILKKEDINNIHKLLGK